MIAMLDGFAHHFDTEIERWRGKVAELRDRGEQMVIWGAGMRGINFLNQFGDERVFPKIVDINTNRQGNYLPGSGYFIDKPEILKAFQPKRVLHRRSRTRPQGRCFHTRCRRDRGQPGR